jgi:DNA polymerase-1
VCNLPDLARYDEIDIDTETTGLTSRDRAVGLSVYLPDDKGYYIRWGHEAGGNNCTRAEFKDWANRELTGKLTGVFNAPFDLRMLAYEDVWLFSNVDDAKRLHDPGVQAVMNNELEPSFKLDALATKHCGKPKLKDSVVDEWCANAFGGKATSKAQIGNYWRAPGDVVEEYAIRDTECTRALRLHFTPIVTSLGLDPIYDVERQIIPMLLKMHMTGVRVDVDRAIELKDDLVTRWQEAQVRWCGLTGQNAFIDSAKRFLPFFEELGLPITHTEKGNPSFSKEVLADYPPDEPLVRLITTLRQLKHYSGTFIDNYILKTVDQFNIIHGEFHSVRNDRYGAVSGRFSSGGELNLQNIPKRDLFWGPLIRGLFIPLLGYRWGKIDYSQIEYRFFAHYAGDRLINMYRDNPLIDFHQAMADMTGHPRAHAKNMNFAALFGAGIKRLAIMLGAPLSEAKRILEEYHELAPEVRDMAHEASRVAKRRGYITTWGGRRHRFPDGRNRYGQSRKALNRLCQGSAADLMKYAMRAIDQVIDWEHVICHLTVHDELDFSVSPCRTGKKMFRDVKDVMEDVNGLGCAREMLVPVIADAEMGPDWGHVSGTEFEE